MRRPASILAIRRPGAHPIPRRQPLGARPERLSIGLLNNMPDAALQATERQFGDLLHAAADDIEIDLRFFSLPEIERGERARCHMHGRYADASLLANAGLDGLIVTGAEPKTSDLADEAYWPSLSGIIDWTETAGLPVIWSCLAAHAAVLRLGGVRRRPLAEKCSGVFTSQIVGDDHLTTDLPEVLATPHSRRNDLREEDLVAAGYKILTRSPMAGVDAFVRRGGSLSLFLQGHPEYDAGSLQREYSRDVTRFLRGERQAQPSAPTDYFDAATERALADLDEQVGSCNPLALMGRYAEVIEAATPIRSWRETAEELYRGWLGEIAAPTPTAVRIAPPSPAWRLRGQFAGRRVPATPATFRARRRAT